MKIFSIAIADNGEVKIAGDLELTQAKQLIEAILLQQSYQAGYNKGQEVKDGKENESKAEESSEGSLPIGS